MSRSFSLKAHLQYEEHLAHMDYIKGHSPRSWTETCPRCPIQEVLPSGSYPDSNQLHAGRQEEREFGGGRVYRYSF
jgi:hypothetical protein